MRYGFLTTALLLSIFIFYSNQNDLYARSNSVTLIKHTPMGDIDLEKTDALLLLNEIRESLSMPRLNENKILSKAAQAHADYLVANRTSTHTENSSKKGFVGKRPMDRALKFGYMARFVGENLSTKNRNAKSSIDGLFSAIYHRFGFLNPLFDEVGIGIAQDPNDPDNSAFVYLMGNSEMDNLCRGKSFKGYGTYVKKGCKDKEFKIKGKRYKDAKRLTRSMSPKTILYPYDGQDEVAPVFYEESPDPLPGYDVSGFPVSATFNYPEHHQINLLSFSLYENGEKKIKDVKVLDKRSDPNHKLTRGEFALLPLKRLKFDTEYVAKLNYILDKKRKKLTWRFRTLKPKGELVIIDQKESTLKLKNGKRYWLYFKPLDKHDLLGTMQFPKGTKIKFIDNNTMSLYIDEDSDRSFDIQGSGRTVHIVIDD